MIASRTNINSVNLARHRRGSYIVKPIAVFGMATPENKVTHLVAVIHKQESRHTVLTSVFCERVLEGCSSPFMQLAEHLTALRACASNVGMVGEKPTCSVPA